MNVLSGTGIDVVPVDPEELAPDEALRALEPDELAVDEEAEAEAAPDSTCVPLDEVDSAEVELALEILLLLARFRTEEAAVSDEPLVLEVGVNSEPEEDEEALAPAPDEEPAVFEVAVAVVPPVDA
jgi:hypothetical protein